MNGMPIHNPLSDAAKDSIAMSKQTGDRNFHLLAFVMMGVSGLAAILHAGHVIYRDMKPARQKGQPERARPHPEAEHDEASQNPPQSWVHKVGVAERPEGHPKVWAEQARRHGHSRQH